MMAADSGDMPLEAVHRAFDLEYYIPEVVDSSSVWRDRPPTATFDGRRIDEHMRKIIWTTPSPSNLKDRIPSECPQRSSIGSRFISGTSEVPVRKSYDANKMYLILWKCSAPLVFRLKCLAYPQPRPRIFTSISKDYRPVMRL
jgi:hypothetical protein